MAADRPAARLTWLERALLRLLDRRSIDGLEIAADDEGDTALQRVEAALALIRTFDPRRYDRIRRDLERIWVHVLPGPLARFQRETQRLRARLALRPQSQLHPGDHRGRDRARSDACEAGAMRRALRRGQARAHRGDLRAARACFRGDTAGREFCTSLDRGQMRKRPPRHSPTRPSRNGSAKAGSRRRAFSACRNGCCACSSG